MPSDGGFTYPGVFNPDTPVPHIVPQSDKTFSTPIVLRNQTEAQALPTTYILTADDLSAPEKDGFYPSYEKARKRGWKTLIMEASHIPQIDQQENWCACWKRWPSRMRPEGARSDSSYRRL
jgi:hypothetical protein